MKDQSGFSAIELLITLFIAATFVAAGYQLYSVITKNSGEARRQARASNIAYDYLRRYETLATAPCTNVAPTPAPTIPSSSNLPNATITASITCPYGIGTPVTKVNVSVKYGNPQVEVAHAIFVTK